MKPLPRPVSLFLTVVMCKIQPFARPKRGTLDSAVQESRNRPYGQILVSSSAGVSSILSLSHSVQAWVMRYSYPGIV